MSLTVEISKIEVEENEQVSVTFNGAYTNGEGVVVPDQPIKYFARSLDENGFTPNPEGVVTTTGNHQTIISLLENLGSADFSFYADTIEQETGVIVDSERYFETISDPCNSDNPLEAPCEILEITQLNLPENTNDGVDNTLYVAVKHTEKDGTPIFDRDVTYNIDNFIGDATVIGEMGTTNTGDYQATVRLNENLGVAAFAVTASTPSLDGTTTLSDSKTVAMQDPCDEGDPAEAPCEEEEENSFSDPNYRSFDRLLHWTDSEGDFILARTLDGQVEIQARQKRVEGFNGNSENQSFAIRDGKDVVEINLTQALTARGLILANGELRDLTQVPLILDSGMIVIFQEPFHYLIRTSTGDHFRITVRDQFLNLASRIASKGRYEGILGNADGNPDNDWTPRGGSPVDTRNYTIEEYGNFIESWRVEGTTSLFSTPFGSFRILDTDWWSNVLTPEEMRIGFQIFEQLFGSVGDGYLPFRFAVDLAANIPAGDLSDVYAQILRLQDPPPRLPKDADLNRNGTPDIQEERPWDFSNLIGGTQSCFEQGGFFNPELNVCLPGYLDCLDQGGNFDTTTGECRFGITPEECQGFGGFFEDEIDECQCNLAFGGIGEIDPTSGECIEFTCNDDVIRVPDALDLVSLTPDQSEVAIVSGQGQILLLSQPDSCREDDPALDGVYYFEREVLASGLNQPWGIALLGDDYLITTRANGGSLERLSGRGQLTTVATELGDPHGIALDPAGNAVIATGDGRILQVDLTTGALTELATGLDPLWDIIQVEGDFFVTTDREGGDVLQVSPEGEVFPLSISSLNQPRGLSSDVNQSFVNFFTTYINDQGNERILTLMVETETTPATVTVFNPFGSTETKTKGVGISGKAFSFSVQLSGYGVFQNDESGLISRVYLFAGAS